MSKQFNFRAMPRDLAAIETIIRLWPDSGLGALNQTEAVQLALHELASTMHAAEHTRAGTHAGNKCSSCRAINGSFAPLD
jgi:hypothetical protein